VELDDALRIVREAGSGKLGELGEDSGGIGGEENH
jgi:hypothetical protein